MRLGGGQLRCLLAAYYGIALQNELDNTRALLSQKVSSRGLGEALTGAGLRPGRKPSAFWHIRGSPCLFISKSYQLL